MPTLLLDISGSNLAAGYFAWNAAASSGIDFALAYLEGPAGFSAMDRGLLNQDAVPGGIDTGEIDFDATFPSGLYRFVYRGRNAEGESQVVKFLLWNGHALTLLLPSSTNPASAPSHSLPIGATSFTLFVGESPQLLANGAEAVEFEVCESESFTGPVWRVVSVGGNNYADFGEWFQPETAYKTRARFIFAGEPGPWGSTGNLTTAAAPA